MTEAGATRAPTSTVALRYLAFQVPGWAIAVLLAYAGTEWWGLTRQLALALLALFVLKDLVMFPFVRRAYEPRSGGGAEALNGRRVIAHEALHPRGYVRLGAELWRAELRHGGVIEPGTELRVIAVRGLTLVVEPEEESRG